MFLLCKHVHLTCGFNKLMMMMILLTNRATHIEVSQDHQTWYHSIC